MSTNREFVTTLYQTYFHRQPDPSGLNWWTQQLDSGVKDRATLEAAFKTSPDMSPDSTRTLQQYLASQGVAPMPGYQFNAGGSAIFPVGGAGASIGSGSSLPLILGVGLLVYLFWP